MPCGNKIPPCFGFILVLESKIPTGSKLQPGLEQEHYCFTWQVLLPRAGLGLYSPSWTSRQVEASPTSAASLYLNSNREQEQTLSCQRKKTALRHPQSALQFLQGWTQPQYPRSPQGWPAHHHGLHTDLISITADPTEPYGTTHRVNKLGKQNSNSTHLSLLFQAHQGHVRTQNTPPNPNTDPQTAPGMYILCNPPNSATSAPSNQGTAAHSAC